ncbi:unnamed protein product [Protopolystoma xenopodis]|uniref:Uncharacterized protein n=1 Tax=Protopolystoma xenopodis TaxID=117903 RepID=A0A3S5BXP6_9PLAT|nr:unnamed protein product [Protopolystoma xenopodis]
MRDRRHISRSRSRSLSQPRSRDRQSPTGNTSGDYKRGDKGSTSEQSMSLRGDRDSGREQRRFREETKENGDARSPDHGRSRRQPFRSPADGRRRRRPASGSQNSRDEDQNE